MEYIKVCHKYQLLWDYYANFTPRIEGEAETQAGDSDHANEVLRGGGYISCYPTEKPSARASTRLAESIAFDFSLRAPCASKPIYLYRRPLCDASSMPERND